LQSQRIPLNKCHFIGILTPDDVLSLPEQPMNAPSLSALFLALTPARMLAGRWR
jgi:hypothetical protein